MDYNLPLSIFLIKENYSDFENTLKDNAHYEIHKIKENLNTDGIVITGINKSNKPSWNNLLKNVLVDYKEQITKSTRAILFVRKSDRLFAFTFGYGRYLLKDESYVRNFGLRVILNNAKRDNIKSIDSKTIDEKPFQTRTQASQSSRFEDFNLMDARTLFRGITAESTNENKYGKYLTGKDFLKITLKFKFEELNELCSSLLTDYKNKDFEKTFPEIARINEITDPEIIESLNNRLIQRFIDMKNIYLVIPEVIDWATTDGFKYTYRGKILPTPSIKGFWDNKQIEKATLTFDVLKKHHIKRLESGEIVEKWRITDCISAEVIHEDRQYIYSIGQWFEIEDDLVTSVDNFIKNIPPCDIEFPPIDGLHERYANIFFEEQIKNLLNMDRDNMRIGNSEYEVCDLLSKQNKLIHVKWWDSSATLSHLFSQGKVSGEILAREEDQRYKINKKVNEVNPDFNSVIQVDGYLPNDYTIVFAIIYKGEKSIVERLPFFSRLNLKQSVKELFGMGYKVELAHIQSSRNRLSVDENKLEIKKMSLEI